MCGKMVLSKKGMNTMRRTYLALSDEDRDYLITLSQKENYSSTNCRSCQNFII